MIGRTLAQLRDFSALPAAQAEAAEVCDLCGLTIPASHRHVLAVATRQIQCACDNCAQLFSDSQKRRLRLVPTDVKRLDGFVMSESAWAALGLPVNLAYFVVTERRVVAYYPSPAGVVESLLEIDAWARLIADNPRLRTMMPDVEALLVNRMGAKQEHLIVPIDRCFELGGIVRKSWHGLRGGQHVGRELAQFFSRLSAAGA